MPRACFYVSGHGFGHAARVQAVVERLLDRPDWTVELRTSTPRWFFRWLLSERCMLSPVDLDPGVVQRDVFLHDAAATRRIWSRLLDRADELVAREAEHLQASGCAVVVGDMVPLAFDAARAAGLPSLAMGNFTWDWILERYLRRRWPSVALSPDQLTDGSWTEPTLALAGADCPDVAADGADQAVEVIAGAARPITT